MLRNYFVIALRNLVKSPGLSGIKIIGLCVGVCGCIIVFLLVKLELSFDKHHTKGENVYRPYTAFKGVWEGTNYGIALPFPSAFRERAVGVESVSQMITANEDVVVNDGGSEKKFTKPNKIAFVDSNYFHVFPDYKWLVGDPRLLTDPNIVVLTESKARTYFGTSDISSVIGKRVAYRDSIEVTVAGIVADVIEKTDFDFTDFISLSTTQTGWMKKEYDFEDWGSTSSSWLCFIRVADGTNVGNLEELLSKMAKEKDDRESKERDVTTFTNYRLQPLSDIHFNTDLGTWDSGRSATSTATIEALFIIAVLLLLVAVINFVNLETAQALRRAKEIGLRKVMGGTRTSLISFLVAESFVITLIAIIFSLPLTKLVMMFFGEFLPKDLTFSMADPFLWPFVIGLTLVVTVLSGIYPALVLSSYQPVAALQANRSTRRSGSAFMRKALTVFQFTFSQVLIAGALIIGLQIAWMLSKDLGFRTDAIVTVQPPWWGSASKRPLLKHELEQLSEVEMICQNSKPPASRGTNSTTLRYNNGKEDVPVSVNVCEGDKAYVDLFNLTLVAGRNVQPVDSLREVLINETYCKKLGVAPADMVGRDLKGGDDKLLHVVGVLKDFHHASLHRQIEPWYYRHSSNSRIFSVRLAKDVDLVAALEKIKEGSRKIYGDSEVTIGFMDETVQKFYESERRISKLANTAMALAIFISCLGLFGLASFTAIQRTKEIGIRKVLGASVNSIAALLSRDFILLVLIAFVIAVPVVWYAGNEWLNTFPYRMDLSMWIFLAAGAMSVLVALVTVGFQAVKAAIVNPVDSLRYE